VYRERRSFYTYVRPMVEDNTFRKRFRMDYTDFMALADILRPKLQRDEKMGALRNGAIPVEFQLAMTLRFLAGGSVFEVMDSNVIARSTAYAIVHRVIDAINQTRQLDCKWPDGDDAEAQAELYRRRSTNGVIRRCVGAMDGLFVRLIQPCLKRHAVPGSFYSGHKKAFGMNFQRTSREELLDPARRCAWAEYVHQDIPPTTMLLPAATYCAQGICNASYEIIAWTMNCPRSLNDRTAFKHSGFDALLSKMPPDCFIVGDAAYPASNRVLVPYPGTALTVSQDAYNFYQSQARISIEQAFGILV
ncbi:unnamed protein product, partial [Ectocarpus sp. 12 AP-2014]